MTEQERISQIEDSLSGLENQVRALRTELNELKESRRTASVTVPQPTAAYVSEEISAPATDLAPAVASVSAEYPTQVITAQTSATQKTAAQTPATQTTSAPKPAAPKAGTSKPPAKKTASGFEENVGGKVMGIVAAVLIFIGLFLFGSMLYERLGDTARIAILFIVSFLILGAGLFLERKRESWFTTSLVGCGFGAVYISLFITGLYYGRFEKEVLYFLILHRISSICMHAMRLVA